MFNIEHLILSMTHLILFKFLNNIKNKNIYHNLCLINHCACKKESAKSSFFLCLLNCSKQ